MEYVLDGTKVTSLEAFYDQISETLIPGAYFGSNLDALDDILSGGFGTPEGGFVLREPIQTYRGLTLAILKR